MVALALGGCGSNGNGKSSGSSGAGGSGQTNTGGGTATNGGTASGATSCTDTADPGELVQVPAGDFMMGCNDAVDKNCDDDEKPQHTVTLSAFEIDKTEVTQAQYTACVVAGACSAPSCDWNCDNRDFPASCVTWANANDYCSWAMKRLPTEAEWEKAARGDKGNKYPWGNDEPDCTHANMAGCGEQLKAVGSIAAGASPYGALDMAGNVVEFVADKYSDKYYATSPAKDPTGPTEGMRYGGRGGGFKSEAEYLRSSKRDWYDPSDNAVSLGFRCAR